jgi:hypothetical protein
LERSENADRKRLAIMERREGYVRLLPASLEDEVDVLIGDVVVLRAENHVSAKAEGLQELVLRHFVLVGQSAWREGEREGGREGGRVK